MNTNSGRVVQWTIGLIMFLCAATIFLLYLFEGNIGGRLLYQAITSGVFCVFLIYIIGINSEKMILQPFAAYIMVGFYLLECLLLCFPNRYVDEWALMYLIAVPIAIFFGFRYAFVAIVATAVFTALGREKAGCELQHVFYILITAASASGKKSKGMDTVSAIIAFLLQAVLLLLTRRFSAPDVVTLGKETAIILMNAVSVPVIYRLSQLKEQGQYAAVEEQTVMTATEQKVVTEGVRPKPLSRPNLSYTAYPLELSMLVSEDCELLKYMREYSPRAVERAIEIAAFARKISYKFGANSDLVYAAALYHDVERIYKGTPGADVVLPEYLYMIVKRQNEKQPPASIEELIVLLSNHVLAIHHYMEKNNANISIVRVIENIFNLQLKKGSIMSVGISMSVYHRMKQEFTNEFMAYLDNKQSGLME